MKTRSKISMAIPYCLNKILKARKTTMVKKVFHSFQSKQLLFTTLFASFCSLSASLVANAAPAISSINGSISHGSSITINGTGFGVKSPAAPYLWANFDDGSSQPSSLGQIRSWTVNNFTPTAGVGVRNTAGMQSYLWNYQESNFSATMGTKPSGFGWNDIGSSWYVFRKGKRNWPVVDMNWKNIRFWYSGGSFTQSIGNGNVVDEGSGSASYMCAWQSTLSAKCKDSITVDQARGYSDARWNTEQFIGRVQSAAGQTDGFYEYIVNGRRAIQLPYFDYNQKNFIMAQGTPGEAWFVHDQSANDPDPPSGARTWWDDIYVDRTWARVMLSNSSTWGTASSGPLYEIQIPTAWSNTSITVQINIGEFSNGATAYLYVVDANGDANAPGFPVTIGGSGGGGGGGLTAPVLTIQATGQ